MRVLGLDPQRDPVAVRARAGYLPGELRFEESLTVEGALRFLNGLRRRSAEWAHVLRLAQRLDLELRSPIRNLSKGNKQKVGLVQALMHRPELLLLDEPTAGLDPLVQREVLRMISEARDQGATVFFSSHILPEVESIADRVGIIRKGLLVEVVDTQALADRSLHRARVRFREPVDLAPLAAVPGVIIVSQGNGAGAVLRVEGEMDGFIKALAGLPVVSLETEQPSLEETFLTYYEQQ